MKTYKVLVCGNTIWNISEILLHRPNMVFPLSNTKSTFAVSFGAHFMRFHIKTYIDWIGAHEVHKLMLTYIFVRKKHMLLLFCFLWPFLQSMFNWYILTLRIGLSVHWFLTKKLLWHLFLLRYNIYFCGFVFCELLNLVIVAGIISNIIVNIIITKIIWTFSLVCDTASDIKELSLKNINFLFNLCDK